MWTSDYGTGVFTGRAQELYDFFGNICSVIGNAEEMMWCDIIKVTFASILQSMLNSGKLGCLIALACRRTRGSTVLKCTCLTLLKPWRGNVYVFVDCTVSCFRLIMSSLFAVSVLSVMLAGEKSALSQERERWPHSLINAASLGCKS